MSELRLRHGKRYTNGMGEVKSVLRRANTELYPLYPFIDTERWADGRKMMAYTPDGRVSYSGKDQQFNLIAEFPARRKAKRSPWGKVRHKRNRHTLSEPYKAIDQEYDDLIESRAAFEKAIDEHEDETPYQAKEEWPKLLAFSIEDLTNALTYVGEAAGDPERLYHLIYLLHCTEGNPSLHDLTSVRDEP